MQDKLVYKKHRVYNTTKVDGKSQRMDVIRHFDLSISVGDSVFLTDGSALSLKSDDKFRFEKYYIVDSYPKITGDYHDLKNIKGTVTKVGIKNRIIYSGFSWCYVQDIIVKVGNAEFRTASKMVTKVN